MSEPIMMKCGCVSHSHVTMIKGVKLDKPLPSCITHDCTEIADSKPDLTGRFARCAYFRTCKHQVPSSLTEAFFEFQGVGSREATEICKCGYHECAHGEKPRFHSINCRKFTPKGPQEFDKYYCGCHGWD